jgi:hypothetical protein
MKKHIIKSTPTVYLLHFTEPYKHARHYLGTARDLPARLIEHRNGTGARLTQVIREAGIGFIVSRTWPGSYDLERLLKGRHSGVRLCPLCNPRPAPYVPGKRRPMGDARPVHFQGVIS